MSAPTLALLVRSFPKLSESFILAEVLGLQEAGFNLIVYALKRPTDELQQPQIARLRRPIVYLPELPEAQLAAELARLWRQANVAHVHAHFIDAPARLAQHACGALGISFSISAHAKDIYLADPQDVAERLAAAKFTVTCTGHNLDQLRQRAVRGGEVHLNHHGVDTDYFSPATTSVGTGSLRLLAVGRLRAKKGYATALRAVAALRKAGLNCALDIVGYGPDEAELRALTMELGIADAVFFLGKRSHRELQQIYREHAIFLAPSEITEDGDRDGIPNVVLEAMASGMPVIASAVSGIPEAITHGEDGWLVPPADAATLAEALRLLASDINLRARLGVNARSRVQRDFSPQASQRRLTELLSSCLSAPRQADIGYVVMGFPRRSEAFISNEMLQLERLGTRLRVFAIKPGDDETPHDSVQQIGAPIEYLPRLASLSGTNFGGWLRNSWSRVGVAHRALFRRHPLRYARVALRAVSMCWRYPRGFLRPRKVFIKEFLQAGCIAEQILRDSGVRHLHGHFCHGATTVTWFAAQLTALPFSFTAHAKDLWQRDQNPGDLLPRKLRAAEFAVTCTDANRQQMHRCSEHDTAVATVYHGLDTEFFRPNKASQAASARPLLLAVGRLVEKKGFRYLIDACAQLRDRGLDFECLIVGEDGPQRPELLQRISEAGLETRFTFQAPVSHDALRRIYERATVFVLPCLIAEDGDRDGIPNVLAEAMAMELAVVSTAVSGIPEIVVDGQNGRLVAERDATALADALAALLTDSALASLLGRNARATILRQFDASRTHVQLKNLFDQSLAKHAKSAARTREQGTADEAIA